MATKLEKAQIAYERLLRELGTRAEMVDELDKADPTIHKKYLRAKEALGDRKFELEMLESEIKRTIEDTGQAKENQEEEMAQIKEELRIKTGKRDAKKGKASPLRSKLAGAEYDIKFVEKGLRDEMDKVKRYKEREEFDKANDYQTNVKRIKIEILKRKKALRNMKKEIKQYENPAKQLDKDVEELKKQIAEYEEKSKGAKDSGSLREELEKQMLEKESDIKRSQMHLKDVLADVGEDLYDKKIKHSVLSKYYQDLDKVAALIDSLQGR
ncbi:MAG: hypothetical protein JRF33_01230 [Deltaproteobacteria bacterium]|nr:hypothetical protein [Deltaproteobacteria bacterium]